MMLSMSDAKHRYKVETQNIGTFYKPVNSYARSCVGGELQSSPFWVGPTMFTLAAVASNTEEGKELKREKVGKCHKRKGQLMLRIPKLRFNFILMDNSETPAKTKIYNN